MRIFRIYERIPSSRFVMGLPQVSSSNIAEEVAASLSTFVQTPSRFVGVSSCDMSGMYVGHLSNRMPGDLTCTSSREPDTLRMHKDSITNVHRLHIVSTEKSCMFTLKGGRNVQSPISRIVGFESKALNSPAFVPEETQCDDLNSPSVVSNAGTATELNGSLVKKRLLSPLNGMCLPDQFNGEFLNISSNAFNGGSQVSSVRCNITVSQEHKKAHISSSDYFSNSIWSTSSFSERKNSQNKHCLTNSSFLTDGPVLENKDTLPLSLSSSSCRGNYIEETTKILSQSGAIPISPEKLVSSPLSLSPLGPKFSGRLKISGGCRVNTEELDCNYLTLKDMEQSLDGTISGILTSQREDFKMASKSFQEGELLQQKFDQFTPESMGAMGENWGQDLAPTIQCAKFGRSLSGLSVRRSLVGSFEESLLSGRLASGIVNQVRVHISLSR